MATRNYKNFKGEIPFINNGVGIVALNILQYNKVHMESTCKE